MSALNPGGMSARKNLMKPDAEFRHLWRDVDRLVYFERSRIVFQACALCEVLPVWNDHHFVPLQIRRVENNEKVSLCRSCHVAIHLFYSNAFLARHLNTLKALRDDERLRKHVAEKVMRLDGVRKSLKKSGGILSH